MLCFVFRSATTQQSRLYGLLSNNPTRPLYLCTHAFRDTLLLVYLTTVSSCRSSSKRVGRFSSLSFPRRLVESRVGSFQVHPGLHGDYWGSGERQVEKASQVYVFVFVGGPFCPRALEFSVSSIVVGVRFTFLCDPYFCACIAPPLSLIHI